MNNVHISMYQGGIDQDTSLVLRDNTTYFYAENIDIINNEDISSGSIRTSKGDSLKFTVSSDFSTFRIVGGTIYKDHLLLFCNTNFGDRIYYTPIESNTIELLSDQSQLVYFGKLGLDISYPIVDIIISEESEDVFKIYWVDGKNPLRMLNIKETDVISKSPEYLDILPKSRSDKINTFIQQGGNLRGGKVSYAFELYTPFGNKTTATSPSTPLSIFKTSGSEENLKTFGVGPEEDSGKSVKVICWVNTTDLLNFSHIRIYGIYYEDSIQVPKVRVVSEFPLGNPDKLLSYPTADYHLYRITDNGENYKAESTIEELYSKTSLVVPKTLEVKNNILFAGNIKDDFTGLLDYDTRAFRFNDRISETGEYHLNLYDSEGDLEFHDTINSSINLRSVPEFYPSDTTIDAINTFNDPSIINNSDSLAKWGNINGSWELGGSGPNIEYYFREGVSEVIGQFYENEHGLRDRTEYLKQRVSLLRDEIYRVALVFTDTRGRDFLPKWIGDIRTPSYIEHPLTSLSLDETWDEVIAKPINLELNIKVAQELIDNDIRSVKIVAIPREGNNRTVLDCGVVGSLVGSEVSSLNGYCFPPRYSIYNPGVYEDGGYIYKNFVFLENVEFADYSYTLKEYISPDIVVNKDLSIVNADLAVPYMEYRRMDTIRTYAKGYSSGLEYTNMQVGYYENSILGGADSLQHNIKNQIVFKDLEYRYSGSEGTYTKEIGGNSIINLSYGSVTNDGNDNAKGICMILEVEDSTGALNPDNNIDVVYIQRKLSQIPYGGGGYLSRFNNEYITISDTTYIGNNSVNTWVENIKTYGDVYIKFFEYIRTVLPNVTSTLNSRGIETLYIPVETKINTSLFKEHPSDKFSLGQLPSGITPTNSTGNFSPQTLSIKEIAGAWFSDTTGENLYYQDYNLYNYNSVYSRLNDAIIYSTPSLDIRDYLVDSFPQKVIASSTKINNELEDSWLKFDTTTELELNKSYGSLNKLLNFKNTLLGFQESGISNIAVQQRELLSGESGLGLQLGTGTVLSRYDYLTTKTGISDIKDVIGSTNLVWYFDKNNQEVFNINSELAWSKLNGLNSFFNNKTITTSQIIYYKPTNEVLLSMQDSENNNFILSINELTTKAEKFYYTTSDISKFNNILGNYNRLFLYEDYFFSPDSKNLYAFKEGEYGNFKGSYEPSKIIIIVNTNKLSTCRYDIVEWFSTVLTSSNTPKNGETISRIRLYNDYQDTGWITASSFKNRFKNWRLNNIRDYLGSDYNNLIHPRIKSEYIYINIEFNNDSGDRIILDPIKTYYTPIKV